MMLMFLNSKIDERFLLTFLLNEALTVIIPLMRALSLMNDLPEIRAAKKFLPEKFTVSAKSSQNLQDTMEVHRWSASL
jgi:hypothetical protein